MYKIHISTIMHPLNNFPKQVTDRLAMFIRNMSDLENNVVAVERIQEYSQVEQEVGIFSVFPKTKVNLGKCLQANVL